MHGIIYYFIFGGICLVGGLFFFPFNGVMRLNGIKNLPDAEKKNIRMKALGINIAIMMFALAVIFILSGTIGYFKTNLSKWFFIVWFVAATADALFISRSNYYFNNRKGGKDN